MPEQPSLDDPHHLHRFLEAQQTTWAQARRELAAGEKRSHWMWFIFPQIHGLGASPTARQYAITGLPEARAYLAHPVLGPRLREATALVNAAHPRTLDQVFGYPDDLKFHSSITLFAHAGPAEPAFQEALRLFFNGQPDTATLRQLSLTRNERNIPWN